MNRTATVAGADREHLVARHRVSRRLAVAALVAGLVLTGCTRGTGAGTPPDGSATPDATIEEDGVLRADLLGSVEDVEGVSWPTGSDGELRETTGVEEPHEVVLDLGEGETFTSTSQLTFLEQRAGELVSVTVQPPADLQPLDAAVDELAAVLEDHGWLDDGLAAELDGWRQVQEGEDEADPLTSAQRSARVDLGAIDVFVKVVPQADGWFWTMDLARPPGDWPTA